MKGGRRQEPDEGGEASFVPFLLSLHFLEPRATVHWSLWLTQTQVPLGPSQVERQIQALLVEKLMKADTGEWNHLKTHSLTCMMADAGCQLAGPLAGTVGWNASM